MHQHVQVKVVEVDRSKKTNSVDDDFVIVVKYKIPNSTYFKKEFGILNIEKEKILFFSFFFFLEF